MKINRMIYRWGMQNMQIVGMRQEDEEEGITVSNKQQ